MSGIVQKGTRMQTIGKNAGNMLGLMHSAIDVEDERIHGFTQWLNNDDFVSTNRKHGKDVSSLAKFNLIEPLKFYDFSGDKQSNYCGFGLKNISKIYKGDVIAQISTEMGLVSNVFIDQDPNASQDSDEEQSLLDQITQNTKTVTQLHFGGDSLKIQENRVYQHLLLTQQLVMQNRKTIEKPTGDIEVHKSKLLVESYMKSYLGLLPQPHEMTNLTYWSKDDLNEIDSHHLQSSYTTTHTFYRSLWHHLVNQEGSPYKDTNSLSYEEFLWAFTIVSSRHVVFHEHKAEEDPDLLLILMPFLDMLNHSRTPNVAITPFVDKLGGDKSFLQLHALRDIQPDEHLTVSYGNLSNSHFIQKYGFTLFDEEQPQYNEVQGGYPFGEYQQIVYEEQILKDELAQDKKIESFNTDNLTGLKLYENKFDPQILSRLRLSFLTSKTIMDYGGTKKLKEEVDFQSYFDQFNEECSVQFMIDSIENDLNHNLKPKEVYEQQLNEMTEIGQIDSISKVNQMNINRMQINEHQILSKNLEYLIKLRKSM